MQFPKPQTATGVPVLLSAIDPNGNYIEIGTTTSDTSGVFSYRWVPPSEIPGKYTVIASFAGSKSYWPSTATTALSVDEVQPTVAPTTTAVSPVEAYFLPAVAAIIIAIVLVGAVLAIMVKKRP